MDLGVIQPCILGWLCGLSLAWATSRGWRTLGPRQENLGLSSTAWNTGHIADASQISGEGLNEVAAVPDTRMWPGNVPGSHSCTKASQKPHVEGTDFN